MSFYVIKVGKSESSSGIAKTAEIYTRKTCHGTTLNITVDNVRIHLDSGDTVGLRRLLEK